MHWSKFLLSKSDLLFQMQKRAYCDPSSRNININPWNKRWMLDKTLHRRHHLLTNPSTKLHINALPAIKPVFSAEEEEKKTIKRWPRIDWPLNVSIYRETHERIHMQNARFEQWIRVSPFVAAAITPPILKCIYIYIYICINVAPMY